MSVRLQRAPLPIARAYRELQAPGLGGVVLFSGRVRPDPTPTGPVTALDYEAHVAVARASLDRLEAAARRRAPQARVVLWHRLGRVPVGEASVLVGVATPHRARAFTLARWLIDRLKAEVPIWKSVPARPGRRRRTRRARSAGR